MERRMRVLGIYARNSSGKSLHDYESKRVPPHPGPLLHKYVEEREMERRAWVLGIYARNSSGESLAQERGLTKSAPGESQERVLAKAPIKPSQAGSNLRLGQWQVVSGQWPELRLRLSPDISQCSEGLFHIVGRAKRQLRPTKL
jgi:hypothetical protein